MASSIPDVQTHPIPDAAVVTKKPDVIEPAAGDVDQATEIDDVVDQAEDKSGSESEIESAAEPRSYIGDEVIIEAAFEDTLLELGRKYNVGYVEIVAANPNIDPILPGEGTKIIIPQRHLLPDAPRTGLVINLDEMRLYNFIDDPNNPTTHPIGIGRDGLNTPTGQTTIVRKKDGPSWRPTARMKKENPELPDVVEPGPDNPLGTHALYLGWPQYLIHGTHKPLGVGRRVSSGCMRMYPEDIVNIFRDVPVGTAVNVIKQPIKMAWIDDMLYIEAHAEDELADNVEATGTVDEYRVPETLFADLKAVAGDDYDRLDWQMIRAAVKERNGRPIAILLDKEQGDDIIPEEILNQASDDIEDGDDQSDVNTSETPVHQYINS